MRTCDPELLALASSAFCTEREKHQLNPQSIHADLGQGQLHVDFEYDVCGPGQGLQRRHHFPDQVGHLASAALGLSMIEQASNPANPLPRIQSFGIDLLKYVSRPGYHRFGAIQEPIAGLAECGDRAERLVELMRNATRHFRQRGDAREFHEPVENGLRSRRVTFEFVQLSPFEAPLSLKVCYKTGPWKDSLQFARYRGSSSLGVPEEICALPLGDHHRPDEADSTLVVILIIAPPRPLH